MRQIFFQYFIVKNYILIYSATLQPKIMSIFKERLAFVQIGNWAIRLRFSRGDRKIRYRPTENS